MLHVKVSRRSLWLAACLLAVFLQMRSGQPARAENITDPKPHLLWEEMVDCELVIVAKYHSHEDKTLSLEVLRSLKGPGVKSGDVVKVSLEHWYSVETVVTGWDWLRVAKSDGIPKLCYKEQLSNPGGLTPVPVVPDVRQPVIYFFPKAQTLALRRRGQVQLGMLAEGWEQAVNGKPMDVLFRLVQSVSPAVYQAGLRNSTRCAISLSSTNFFSGCSTHRPLSVFLRFTVTVLRRH